MPAATVDLPCPAWSDLVTELGLEPHGLAHQLLQEHGAPSLSAQPTLFAGLVTPSANWSAKSLLLRQSASEGPACALVAVLWSLVAGEG
jgi:hypothetical protein